MVNTASKTGFISQIIGPVLDIEFPNGELPKIYNALVITPDKGEEITCEVQQLLGNNKVRAVSMTSTDGLKRGATVMDTGAPITVPPVGYYLFPQYSLSLKLLLRPFTIIL